MASSSAIIEPEHVLAPSQLELAIQGDELARRNLARELWPRVRNQMIYLVAIPHERDDLTQLAMIEILQSLHTYSHQGSFLGWADKITVRTAMRHLKKERWWRRCFLNELPQELIQHRGGAPADERVILRARLSVLLHKLTPDRRAALVLRYIHGYSIQEIAQLTQALENTVRGRLRTGKKQLKQLIERDDALRDFIDAFQDSGADDEDQDEDSSNSGDGRRRA